MLHSMIGLLGPLYVALYAFTCNADYVLKEVEVNVASESGKPVRIFTSEAMLSYDGTDESKPIYMGIKGVVFDVSSGKRFYGKGSPYNSLVGKDCTKAVAKMSLDEKDFTHDISDLPENYLKMLDETFEGTYLAKYPIVGYMDYFRDQNPHKFKNIKTEL